jgi:alanine racemase
VTLRLTVNEVAWKQHVQSVAKSYPGIVPVVKGNGYGFRRWNLMPLAGQLSNEIAVGTVFEARDIPSGVTPIVLTPTMTQPPTTLPLSTVLTVGSVEHVVALSRFGWSGRVMVKLQSSMKRHGVAPTDFRKLMADIDRSPLTVHGFSIHPPLDGDMSLHLDDITKWLDKLPIDAPVYVSHLDVATYERLCTAHTDRTFRVRLGTKLWHGDKSMMHLTADILGAHSLEAGERAGYRLTQTTGSGQVVLVGAGSAHGVLPLEDGRSPFHYQRSRLNLLEPPHMHTSMLFVARGRAIPAVGEWIDVQRPLTQVQVDLLQWTA